MAFLAQTLEIGIVGLGEHSLRAHIKHLIKDPRVKIVCAFDPNPDAKEKMRSYGLNCTFFTDEKAFWNHPMQAVVIASPDRFHATQMQIATNLNLHIFCEKPMTVNEEDLAILHTVLEKAKTNNLVVATCHPRRLDPPFMWLKEQIDTGNLNQALGKVLHFDFTFWYKKIEDTPEDAWKKERSLLSDHFGHEIDLLAFLFPQDIQTIYATKKCDNYQHYEVNGDNGKGLQFRFLGLRKMEELVYDEIIQITAEKGSWILNLSKGKIITLPNMTIADIPEINYDVRFEAVNHNFVDAILGVNQNYLNSEDLLRNNTLSVLLDKKGTGSW